MARYGTDTTSEVVWVDTQGMAFDNSVIHKLLRLLDRARVSEDLSEGMRVALKVNTAEEGYEYGLRPVFVRVMADLVDQATRKRPVVCDGLKLVDYWRQSKGNAFLGAASSRGYANATLGGHFVINGGFSGDEGNLYPIQGRNSELGGVKVGTAVCRSDALWVLSHVTLHPLFGLSGALLNGGFECLVGSERTRIIRGLQPYAFNGHVNPPPREVRRFQRWALESHLGVQAALEGRVFYVNYIWDVTPHPEYYPYSAEPIVENAGFLASRDPVAVDAVTLSILEEGLTSRGRVMDPIYGRVKADFADVLRVAESLGIGTSAPSLDRLS